MRLFALQLSQGDFNARSVRGIACAPPAKKVNSAVHLTFRYRRSLTMTDAHSGTPELGGK